MTPTIIDLVLEVLEAYVKSTPRKWDDLVFSLVKGILTNPDFLDLLRKRAEAKGMELDQ